MKTTIDPRQALAASQSTPDPDRALRSRRNLKQSCQDFEAIFIQSLFKEMRKTVPEGVRGGWRRACLGAYVSAHED